jgi:hypothetical protein
MLAKYLLKADCFYATPGVIANNNPNFMLFNFLARKTLNMQGLEPNITVHLLY